jgi:hypothetical protein
MEATRLMVEEVCLFENINFTWEWLAKRSERITEMRMSDLFEMREKARVRLHMALLFNLFKDKLKWNDLHENRVKLVMQMISDEMDGVVEANGTEAKDIHALKTLNAIAEHVQFLQTKQIPPPPPSRFKKTMVISFFGCIVISSIYLYERNLMSFMWSFK